MFEPKNSDWLDARFTYLTSSEECLANAQTLSVEVRYLFHLLRCENYYTVKVIMLGTPYCIKTAVSLKGILLY